MKYYQLNKENYIKEKDLHIIHVYDKTWSESYKDTIELLINYFNEEYEWKDMFNLNGAVERIKAGENLFLLYVERRAIGYVWFRELNKDTCFGYNLFVTKKVDRPKYAAKWFYNNVSGLMLNNYQVIKVEIEDWNKRVIDLVENMGYKEV
jgi:hypothetical protein